jgi:hypothetical protein
VVNRPVSPLSRACRRRPPAPRGFVAGSIAGRPRGVGARSNTAARPSR